MRSAFLIISLFVLATTAHAKNGPSNISFERKWTSALVTGNKTLLSRYLAPDVTVTRNVKGKPAQTTLNDVMETFHKCTLSRSERDAYFLTGAKRLSFECPSSSSDTLEYKWKEGRVTALHFYVNAPCPTPDCN